MNRNRLYFGLGALLGIALLFIIYLSWPYLVGQEIVLDTRPVDPFDPLRGQYMVINYEVGTIPSLAGAEEGETVYVALAEEDGIWRYADAGFERPSNGIFLRGTVMRNNGETMNVRYGIEQFFFERNADVPTTNITVAVKVSDMGGARILGLLQNGEPVDITYKPVSLKS